MPQRGPRIYLRRPAAVEIARFLAEQRELPLSYARPAGGVLAPPPGFVVDARRVQIGTGERAFRAAAETLRRWHMFDPRWIEIMPDTTPIEVGRVVAVLVRMPPAWWLNATRVVEVLGDQPDRRRFGFAYGTQPAHAETGEERFLVEQVPDGSVWYDLRAFSRPSTWLVRLGYPAARWLQGRAGRGSIAILRRAAERP